MRVGELQTEPLVERSGKSTKEGESPVGENGFGSLDQAPKYHGTRETRWESARTISQG